MLLKWSRSNPPPRINPSNPPFRVRRIFRISIPPYFVTDDIFANWIPRYVSKKKVLKSVLKDGIRNADIWLVRKFQGFRKEFLGRWLVTWESHISSTFSNKLFTSDYRNCKFTFIRIQAANFLEPYGIFLEIFQKFSPDPNPQNHFFSFLDILKLRISP